MLLLEQILNIAKEYNLPANNPRMILTEYLQCEVLDSLYKQAPNLHFIGGTCLHLLHGLPRFSEDLDFVKWGQPPFYIRNVLYQNVRLKMFKAKLSTGVC